MGLVYNIKTSFGVEILVYSTWEAEERGERVLFKSKYMENLDFDHNRKRMLVQSRSLDPDSLSPVMVPVYPRSNNNPIRMFETKKSIFRAYILKLWVYLIINYRFIRLYIDSDYYDG